MNKKILIVSDTPTHPVIGGNRACIIQNAELLREIGYDVYFLYVHNYDAPESVITPTKTYWGDRFFFFRLNGLQHFYRRVMARIHPESFNRIDFLYPWGLNNYINELNNDYGFHGLLVNYVWLTKLVKTTIPIKALYTHDVFSYRSERVATADYAWRSFPASEEAKGIRRFSNVLAIQSNEALYFKYLAPKRNVITVYSPVTPNIQELTINNNILFFSGGGELNVNGIRWFLREVWPILKRHNQRYKLLIGGGISNELKSNVDADDVEIIGRVDDPAEFYSRGDIVINPIYQGTGLKIKTLEAIAYGKFVVSTSHSAEGLYNHDKLPLTIADTPTDFAQAIISNICNRDSLLTTKYNCKSYIDSYNSYIKSIYTDIFDR